MKIISNEKVRVTLLDEEYNSYVKPERKQILPLGDTRISSSEAETRGHILSCAMSALGNRCEYEAIKNDTINPELDLDAARGAIRHSLMLEYLQEHGNHYRDLTMRWLGGHRLSAGMEITVADASAYVDGLLGECDMKKLWQLAGEIIEKNLSRSEENREFRRISMMSPSNELSHINKQIMDCAIRIRLSSTDTLEREKRYRKHFSFDKMRIEVLRPDLMPEQIGLCRYSAM